MIILEENFMSKQLRVYREGAKTEFDYQILWEEDFTKLADAVKKLELSCGKICIVADDTVGNLYGKEVQKALEELDVTVDLYTFPAGEASKNLDTVKELYAFLIEHHYTRKDVLAALGGGVTGDLTGYAAATYLRGIDFIQIPTTLLAQVDSSVGGKTGVDFAQYKNMVGAFHQPRLVYMNLNTLKTLPEDQFASGMGEVLKSGLIRDARFYEWTINHMSEIPAIEDIRQNYAGLYGVEELSERLGVSKSHLVRTFTAAVGVPPGRYLTTVRVEAAMRLLLHREYTLDVIASLCGFSGANYLCRVFKKETGQSPAQWRALAGQTARPLMDYIEIMGDVTNFAGALQLNIKRARKAREGEYDPTDYLPVSKCDIDEMYGELMAIIKTIQNPYLSRLLELFFVEDEAFIKRFRFNSAAKTVHHGFVGGLLEHTLNVTKLCDFYTKAYPALNRDLR